MVKRPTSRQVREWEQETLRSSRRSPRSLALYGEKAAAEWARVLDQFCGDGSLRTIVLLDEARLREQLLVRLPEQGVPAGQVLGALEELAELANEARRLALVTDDELSAARRVLGAVLTDARRASAGQPAPAEVTGPAEYTSFPLSLRTLKMPISFKSRDRVACVTLYPFFSSVAASSSCVSICRSLMSLSIAF